MIITLQPVMNYLFYILFVYCVNLGIKKQNIFNPYFLFSITLLSLTFYNPKFSSFLMNIPYDVYLLIFFGITSFLIGLITVDKIGKKKKQSEVANIQTMNKKLFWIALVIGLIPHIIGINKVGIPLFNPNNLTELRSNYLPAGLSYLIFFLPLTITIAFANKNNKLISLSVMLNLFFSVIMVSKFDIAVFIFFFLFSYLKYGTKKLTTFKKHFIFIGILAVIPYIFAWSYSLRNQTEAVNSKFLLSNTFFSQEFSNAISLPYFYFTTAWSNFAQTILSVQEFNYGAYTFYPFFSALQIEDLISYVSSKTIYIHPFNTFSFLTDYYMDFGIIGLIICPFLLGILVFHSYKKSIMATNPIIDGQFIILALPTLLLFFSNHFTSVGYPFIVYILYGIIGKVARIKIQ